MKKLYLFLEIICALGVGSGIGFFIISDTPFGVLFLLISLGFLIHFILCAIEYERAKDNPSNNRFRYMFRINKTLT